MKTLSLLTVFQLILSTLSAYLLSQMSWLGKMGINLFYQEYRILKNPIETGIVIFILQMCVVLLLFLFYRFSNKTLTNIIAAIFLVIAIGGLSYTIYDFTQEFSHRILKTYFHIGGYIFWFGFIFTSLVFLIKPQKTVKSVNDPIEERQN